MSGLVSSLRDYKHLTFLITSDYKVSTTALWFFDQGSWQGIAERGWFNSFSRPERRSATPAAQFRNIPFSLSVFPVYLFILKGGEP
jgi:hypothetical protein